MYVCGITPYDATHLGHANTYLAFDLINRYLRATGAQVNFVENITITPPQTERILQLREDYGNVPNSSNTRYAVAKRHPEKEGTGSRLSSG